MSGVPEGTAVLAPFDEEMPAQSATPILPRGQWTRFTRAVERFLPSRSSGADIQPPVDRSIPAREPPEFEDTEATWWSLT